ncbi:MAG: hypothetical protein FWE21_09545 [Defluviitaleaceae bacterium]|nr:hypothetical protein [Defluviitaleaceae bacterium]
MLRYPDTAAAFIGNGVVVDMRREMKIAHEKLKQTLEAKGAANGLKKLNALGGYANVAYKDFNNFVMRFQKIQSKHGFSVNMPKSMKLAK